MGDQEEDSFNVRSAKTVVRLMNELNECTKSRCSMDCDIFNLE